MTIFHSRPLKFNQKNEEKVAVKIENQEDQCLNNKKPDLKLDVEDEKNCTKRCAYICDPVFLCDCAGWIAIGFMILFIVCLMIYFLIILGYGAFCLITNIIEYVSK